MHENTAQMKNWTGVARAFLWGPVSLALAGAKIRSSAVQWKLLPWRKGHLFTLPSEVAGTSGVVVPEHLRHG